MEIKVRTFWLTFPNYPVCKIFNCTIQCVIRIHESHIFVLRKIHFKQMKIIAVYTQLKQLRNKAWKKFRPERESNPWPLRYRCSALTNWAIKPTGSWSIVSSLYTRRWRRCDKNTWKSYICTAENTFFDREINKYTNIQINK